MISMKNSSIQDRRNLLDKAGGRIFSVRFIKKDGTLRDMTCKKWTERHYTYGSENARENTCAHKPNIYTVSDIGAADAFRNINLETLISAKVNGEEYIF